jgi:hypothetical protein
MPRASCTTTTRCKMPERHILCAPSNASSDDLAVLRAPRPLHSSLPGLTRQSIHLLPKMMDARVMWAFTPVFDGLCPRMTIEQAVSSTHASSLSRGIKFGVAGISNRRRSDFARLIGLFSARCKVHARGAYLQRSTEAGQMGNVSPQFWPARRCRFESVCCGKSTDSCLLRTLRYPGGHMHGGLQ